MDKSEMRIIAGPNGNFIMTYPGREELVLEHSKKLLGFLKTLESDLPDGASVQDHKKEVMDLTRRLL